MKFTLRLFVILFSFSITPFAASADWVKVSEGTNVFIEIDKSSIVRQKDGSRKAWTRFIYNDLQKNNNGLLFNRIIQLSLHRCADRTIGILQQHMFNDDISTTSVENHSFTRDQAKFIEIIPDSHGDPILEYVCSFPVKKK